MYPIFPQQIKKNERKKDWTTNGRIPGDPYQQLRNARPTWLNDMRRHAVVLWPDADGRVEWNAAGHEYVRLCNCRPATGACLDCHCRLLDQYETAALVFKRETSKHESAQLDTLIKFGPLICQLDAMWGIGAILSKC